MLRKPLPGSLKKLLSSGTVKKLIGWGIVAELSGLAFVYFGWNRLNHDRSVRYHFHENYYWVLNGFYSVGELMNKEYKAREEDIEIWKSEGKL